MVMIFQAPVIGYIVGAVVAALLGVGGVPALAIGIAFAGLATAFWAYSPLPDVTASTVSGSAVGAGYWGLSPPEDDDEVSDS